MRRDGRILPVREGLGRLSCPFLPGAAALGWAGSRLLVAGERLWELDLDSGQREVLAELDRPRALAVSPEGERAVIAEGDRLVVMGLRDAVREAELELEAPAEAVGWFFAGAHPAVWARLPGAALLADPTLANHRRVALPPGVSLGTDRRGRLVMASAGEEGLHLAGPGRPPEPGRWPVRVTEAGLVAELRPDVVLLHRAHQGTLRLAVERPSAFAVAPSGALLALGTEGGELWLGNVLGSNLKPLDTEGQEPGPIRALAFSPRGSQLAALGTALHAWGW